MSIKTPIRIAFLSIFGMLISLYAQNVNAQIAPAPCDPQYMQSLEARAWLEAEREIVQNQNLIFKPDSVFEYTCFDQFMGELADNASTMFSETIRWPPTSASNPLPFVSMTASLNLAIYDVLASYDLANFPTGLLGGRSQTMDYTPAPVLPGSYQCDVMRRVWEEAKCMNFIASEDHDGFMSFEEYRDGESHRFEPFPCIKDLRWADNINTAYANVPWQQDTVNLYTEQLQDCGETTPIETGVRIRRPRELPQEFDEKICIPASCYYVPAVDRCMPSL